jgi:hypothetical protein
MPQQVHSFLRQGKREDATGGYRFQFHHLARAKYQVLCFNRGQNSISNAATNNKPVSKNQTFRFNKETKKSKVMLGCMIFPRFLRVMNGLVSNCYVPNIIFRSTKYRLITKLIAQIEANS